VLRDKVTNMFTYYKSKAPNNVSFRYFSIFLEGLTKFCTGGSNFYITNEYLCSRSVATFINNTGFVQIVKTVFQDFPGLAKTKFQGFPGLTKLVFEDFPKQIRFTNMAA